MEDYRTIRGTATGEYEEKKSRFIAQLSFADSEEKAVAFLEQVRAANRTARHNVYAYRLREGNRERYSDDGEPQGTAGQPMLNVFQREEVTNVCCVVTRYFGGILLGAGGLIRAYAQGSKAALDAARWRRKRSHPSSAPSAGMTRLKRSTDPAWTSTRSARCATRRSRASAPTRCDRKKAIRKGACALRRLLLF